MKIMYIIMGYLMVSATVKLIKLAVFGKKGKFNGRKRYGRKSLVSKVIALTITNRLHYRIDDLLKQQRQRRLAALKPPVGNNVVVLKKKAGGA
jgi:hypothetical protein